MKMFFAIINNYVLHSLRIDEIGDVLESARPTHIICYFMVRNRLNRTRQKSEYEDEFQQVADECRLLLMR